MYIKRKLEGTILTYLDAPEIFAIVGPRQCGKTTMLKNIQSGLKDSAFINFEDIEILTMFENDIKEFAKKYLAQKYLFIDEFQHASHGGKNLKFLYDTYPDKKIIISGSSAIDLTIKALKFLVGRVFIFNLFGLDFEEYLSFRDPSLFPLYTEYQRHISWKGLKISPLKIGDVINGQLQAVAEEFIIWGGYPRVATTVGEEEKKIVLKNIYNTYFLRDIKDILGLIDDYRMKKLIEATAVQIGQLVDYNELGQMASYDYLTLKKYLNVLEKTFICQPIRPFFSNRRKEISKNPKIYFFDTGLRNYIVQNFNPLTIRVDKGQLYENFVFTQLLKRDFTPNFWRSKTQSEVDFVIKAGPEIIPIESKSSANKAAVPHSLVSFIREYHPPHALILGEASRHSTKTEKTKIHFLPRWII
ncbi:MAG: ATP-binding protein [Candidatus Magasanikbacteria bacterium]|nr:ATP-binding protein [Candidatus Magasanikbacteria bacterium]